MERAGRLRVRGVCSFTRLSAAAFLDSLSLESSLNAIDRQNCIAGWIKVGDDHCVLGDRNIQTGATERATEARLNALTAFEIARRLLDPDDPRSAEVTAKVECSIQRLNSSLAEKIEQVILEGYDDAELSAYYLPGGAPKSPAPAIICLSMEEETAVTLLGRVLPVLIGRSMSALVICHDDIAKNSPGESQAIFSHCLDYLSARADVDASRIGVYGEGGSAVLATGFAVSDPRVAAAVCDGGLWNWVRTTTTVRWMSGGVDVADEALISARRSQLLRQLSCPVLVVAGGRGIVSVSEATSLQADCAAANIDLVVALPRMSRTPGGEIENFVTSDDCIFDWLEHRLVGRSLPYLT